MFSEKTETGLLLAALLAMLVGGWSLGGSLATLFGGFHEVLPGTFAILVFVLWGWVSHQIVRSQGARRKLDQDDQKRYEVRSND